MTRHMRHVNIFIFTIIFMTGDAFALSLDKVGIHGFLSQGYFKTDNNNFTDNQDEGSWKFREIGTNITIPVFSDLSLGMQLLAIEYGNIGGRKVQLDWANANYRLCDEISFRAGKIKIPLGLYNDTRDIDMLRPFILLPTSIYNEVWRDLYSNMLGGCISGSLPYGFSYSLQGGKHTVDEDSGYPYTVGNFMDVKDINGGDVYNGFLQWETPFNLKLRMTYNEFDFDLRGDFIAGGMDADATIEINYDYYRSIVYSAEYSIGAFVITAEYMQRRIQFDTITEGFMTIDMGPMGSRQVSMDDVSNNETRDSHGYYLSCSYRPTYWIELSGYYSFNNVDDDSNKNTLFTDESGMSTNLHGNYHDDRAFTIRFDIIENITLKTEYHYIVGNQKIPAFLNPQGRERYTNLYAAKLTYSF